MAETTRGSGSEEFDQYAEARAYGRYHNIPQAEGEADEAYRNRVAGELRRQGKIIEAHEVASGRRWDDPEQGLGGPMTGIVGAMAQIMNGNEYSPHDPQRQIGDDIAAGIVATHRDHSGEAIAALFDAVGPEIGMDVIDALSRRPQD